MNTTGMKKEEKTAAKPATANLAAPWRVSFYYPPKRNELLTSKLGQQVHVAVPTLDAALKLARRALPPGAFRVDVEESRMFIGRTFWRLAARRYKNKTGVGKLVLINEGEGGAS
jgi:hypothetical protein